MLARLLVVLWLSQLIILSTGKSGVTPAAANNFEFTEDYLKDRKTVQLGKKVFKRRCNHCHGKKAYPGKAPKLKPESLDPEFIYDRATNGFKSMPRFKTIISERERRAVVAYIKTRLKTIK